MAIGEDQIGELVDAFYAKVRADEMIGPLFDAAIDDWPAHLVKLQAFWSSVMLGSGRYKGSPMAAHIRHRSHIEPDMFGRWLKLWRESASELLAADDAGAIVAKAERIAQSLQLGLFFQIERGRDAA